MRRVRALHLLFAFPFMASASSGFDGAELLTLRSTVLGEERVFAVMTPTTYSRGQERYPVLYLTDGDAHLGHARASAEFLARINLMPEVILVGIPNTSRSRDLTPTPGTAEERAAFLNAGGGERFLDFIEHELVPLARHAGLAAGRARAASRPPGSAHLWNASQGSRSRSGGDGSHARYRRGNGAGGCGLPAGVCVRGARTLHTCLTW